MRMFDYSVPANPAPMMRIFFCIKLKAVEISR